MSALYELYDSDEPFAIPVGVAAAGYDDGYAAAIWTSEGWARFPDALHITVFGNPASDIADVETGDLTPASGAQWARTKKSRGQVGIVYVNRANGHLVEAALRAEGISIAECLLWIATDDGTQTVTVWDDGSPVTYPVWAVQYLNEAHGSGGHYDRSLVYLAFGAGGGSGGSEVTDPRLMQLLSDFYPQSADPNPRGRLAWLLNAEGITAATLADRLTKIEADLANPPGSGGTPEPPEPAEPTKGTLHVPAQDIPISFP